MGITNSPKNSNRLYSIIENWKWLGFYFKSAVNLEKKLNEDRSSDNELVYTLDLCWFQVKKTGVCINVSYHKSTGWWKGTFKGGKCFFMAIIMTYGLILKTKTSEWLFAWWRGSTGFEEGGTNWSTYMNNLQLKFYRLPTIIVSLIGFMVAQQRYSTVRIRHRKLMGGSISQKVIGIDRRWRKCWIAPDP